MQESSMGYHGPGPASYREQEAGEQDRVYAQFMERVIELSGLATVREAQAATRFVLRALEFRLEEDELVPLHYALPPGVDVLLQRANQGEGELTGTSRAALFRDTARNLGLSTEQAGGVVAGVLTALREAISEAESEAIANALAPDLQALWNRPSSACRVVPADPAVAAERARRHEEHLSQALRALVHEIEMEGRLSPALAERAAVAVTCRLDSRLMGEGPHLKAQLPKRLQEMLIDCSKGLNRPDKFDLHTLYSLVADDLALPFEQAVAVVAAVFSALKKHISGGEAGQVAAQLPKDIAGAWRCA